MGLRTYICKSTMVRASSFNRLSKESHDLSSETCHVLPLFTFTTPAIYSYRAVSVLAFDSLRLAKDSSLLIHHGPDGGILQICH